VKDLNGHSGEDFIASLQTNFRIEKTNSKVPPHPRAIGMYFNREWQMLHYAVENVREPDPIESLDVSILQQNILAPILGIDDPRTNDRVTFVGGNRGTDELERLVNSGDYKVAFSMYPTSMDELLAVSDMGEIMPPKSTWFEPKLKDGLFVHLI